MLNTPKNTYTVHVVSKKRGRLEVQAHSAEEAEEMLDCMDEDQITWFDEQWPEVRSEMERKGRHSLDDIIKAVVEFLKNDDTLSGLRFDKLNELTGMLDREWTGFMLNGKAKTLVAIHKERT